MNKTETKEKEQDTQDQTKSKTFGASEPRPEKVELVAEVKALFENSQGVVFTEYRGLDVLSMKELRVSLNDAGTSYKVYKNTLVRRAVAELKLEEKFAELLKGPVGLAFVEADADYSETARVLAAFKKLHDVLVIKGGFSDGELMDEEAYAAFAKLPPLAVLQAQFASALQSPLSSLAGLMNAILQKLAGQLSALKDKVEKEAPTESVEEKEVIEDKPEKEAPTESVEEKEVTEDNTAEEETKDEAEVATSENSEEAKPEGEEDTPVEETKDEADQAEQAEQPAEDNAEPEQQEESTTEETEETNS